MTTRIPTDMTFTPGELLRGEATSRIPRRNRGRAYAALSKILTEAAVNRGAPAMTRVVIAHDLSRSVRGHARYDARNGTIMLDASLLPVTPDQLDLSDGTHMQALLTLNGIFLAHAAYAAHRCDAAHATHGLEAMSETLDFGRSWMRHIDQHPDDAALMRVGMRQLAADCIQQSLNAPQSTDATRGTRSAMEAFLMLETLMQSGVVQAEEAQQLTRLLAASLPAGAEALITSEVAVAIAASDADAATAITQAISALEALYTDAEGAGANYGSVLDVHSISNGSPQLIAALEAMNEAIASATDEDVDALLRGYGVWVDRAALLVSQVTLLMEDEEWDENEDYDPSSGYGYGYNSQIGGQLIKLKEGERMPTPQEHALRSRLAGHLRKARHRAPSKARQDQENPGGRLRGREAMRAAAQKSMGKLVDAKPWRVAHRAEALEPKLSVALIIDTSGSMSQQIQRCESATWVLAGACHDAKGSLHASTFGDAAEVLADTSKSMTQYVRRILASGGTALADTCVEWATASLRLNEPATGPRLVCLLSDGYFADRTARMVDELRENGALVVQIGFGETPANHGAQETLTCDDTEDLIQRLGVICARELASW